MAITIDRLTQIIHIPQADLTWVSGTIYELDTNWFRLQLKAIEASEEGMPWPDTHTHNTEYTVAGVTYARAFQIVAPYSVEFEDGQYTVKLTGSNNNIFDVDAGILVQNQVQVIPSNSAGLTSPGYTATDAARLRDVWAYKGFDATNPATFASNSVVVGGKTLVITDNGNGTYTVQPQ